MKFFDDAFEPIEVQVKDSEGKEYLLKSNFVTSDDYNKILKMNNLITEDPSLSVDLIYDTVVLIFGRTKDFYKKFSLGLLASLSEYGIKEVISKNKNSAKKNKK